MSISGLSGGYSSHIDSTPDLYAYYQTNQGQNFQPNPDDLSQLLEKLNSDIYNAISSGDTARSRLILNSILKNLKGQVKDNLTVSNSQYYIGVYYLLKGQNPEAINWLRLSASIREQIKTYDETFSKCLFNLGIAYSNQGDLKRMEHYFLRSYEIEKEIRGKSSPRLISVLSAIVSVYIGLNEYDTAINYGNIALGIMGNGKETFNSDFPLLYTNIGVCYARLSDYSKAVLYLEKAESFYKLYSLHEDENYINILNSLASSYFFLGLNEKSDEYFNKGIEKIEFLTSSVSLNFLNSFALMLGNAGQIKRGEDILQSTLIKAFNFYGPDSKDYIVVLKNYAEYLRVYKIDLRRSLSIYEQCVQYLNKHNEDLELRDPIYLGYALVLTEKGESKNALSVIQKLLFMGNSEKKSFGETENPVMNDIEPVQGSINILKAKYRILWDIFNKQKKTDYLFAAAETSELIIALIEKVRINISEEESRLVLGDRFRDSYLFAIRDFYLCYQTTGGKEFLNKAFQYSEKCKVAGLLASTRELKATQFQIPSDIADLERKLKNEIGFYEARISEEKMKNSPDSLLLSEWGGQVLDDMQRRDSLIRMFEKKFPEYFLMKYNTNVIKPEKIPGLIGRKSNYLNYVISDTLLYIFLTNRKFTQLFAIPVDSVFFNNIRTFRTFLTKPGNDAKTDLIQYSEIGNYLYDKLIDPVRKYLISNEVLISPDNILSYIPFEALPANSLKKTGILFNNLQFLINDFDISYTYSATLLGESLKQNYNLTNSLVAFAPIYTGKINVDSLLKSRQAGAYTLGDLQFARNEARYVTDLTGGSLFINDQARESAFKSEAGKYDIIHLAMHTVLNDQNPMYSKMLFYPENDSTEDGNLNTYEVYGIPLKAKMVVLSSCNTGTGTMHSGEGILSLARGFIYSGGQSVVMSLWEIEDQSGSEIVKYFYHFLKQGAKKSNALRKARIKYLENADMLRSHPYFWSSLVIYGNNASLYLTYKLLVMAGLILIASGIIFLLRHQLRSK